MDLLQRILPQLQKKRADIIRKPNAEAFKLRPSAFAAENDFSFWMLIDSKKY